MNCNSKQNVNGNIQDYVQLLSANQHRIYAYILSMLHNSSDADDIMQETAVVMLDKFSEFKVGTDFVAWGIAIAHYRILKFRNNQKGKCAQLSDEAIGAIDADAIKVLRETDYRMDALRHCIGKLPEKELQLIQLRYDKELSVKVIARKYGKNIRAIYRAISRSHELLLHCIQNKLMSEVEE